MEKLRIVEKPLLSEYIGRRIDPFKIQQICECEKKGDGLYQLYFKSKSNHSCSNVRIKCLRIIINIKTEENIITEINKSIDIYLIKEIPFQAKHLK